MVSIYAIPDPGISTFHVESSQIFLTKYLSHWIYNTYVLGCEIHSKIYIFFL